MFYNVGSIQAHSVQLSPDWGALYPDWGTQYPDWGTLVPRFAHSSPDGDSNDPQVDD